MIFLITVLACLLIGSGLSAVFVGSGMIVLERGWSMVISGSIVATGGVLLLGIAMLLRELRRLPDRLAEVLPEVVPSHFSDPGYNFEGGHIAEPAGVDSAPRPRLDPMLADVPSLRERMEPESGASLGRLPADPPPADTLVPDTPREDIQPPSMPPVSAPATADIIKDAGETTSSALKIQISLHGDERPSAAGRLSDKISPSLPAAGDVGETENMGAGKQGRPFWSRLGRSDKPITDPATAPVVADREPEEPAGPTAAERARERLALADTPEKDKGTTDTGAPSRAQSDDGKEAKTKATPADTRGASAGTADVADRTEDDKAVKPAAAQRPAPEDRSEKDEASPAVQNAATSPTATSPTAMSSMANSSASTSPGAEEAVDDSGAKDSEPAIVGSYRAGGNLYVMFDDGSIEAETPRGIFRFATLDNLKAYIASGEDPALAGPRVERPATGVDSQTAPIIDAAEKPAS